MGAYKKVKQIKTPDESNAVYCSDPKQYFSVSPTWNFSSCDQEKWSINSKEVQAIFWAEILPRLQDLEKLTWAEILKTKKQNHQIEVTSLNKVAIERLTKMYIEAQSIYSLRLTGKHRIYGYIKKAAFNILWIDLDHGDNTTCVCRSHKKHT